MNITALIPAAGYSSRMGYYKPLLPVGSLLVIERAVNTFYDAGITDVRVVVGHKAHLLRPVLERLGVRILENPNYARGMYSSIQIGVQSLSRQEGAFFLLPADYAFVAPATVKKILEIYNEVKTCDIIFPSYQGKTGHPPLISSSLYKEILTTEPEGGLQEILSRVKNAMVIEIDDPGMMKDLDTEQDYLEAMGYPQPLYPSRRECLQIFNQYQREKKILAHVEEVARVAGVIAEHLNSKGFKIKLGLVMAGSLLHDIAKGEKEHAYRGQDILNSLGYPAVGDIIAAHMDLPPNHIDKIDEYSIVYLADKMVQGDQVVSLEKRLLNKLLQYKDNATAQAIISKRLDHARIVKQNIEQVLQLNLEEIL